MKVIIERDTDRGTVTDVYEDAGVQPWALADVVEWREKAAELDDLREEGRVMPDGLSWPRYEDGEPLCIGDELDIDGEAVAVERVELSEMCYLVRGAGRAMVRAQGCPVKRHAPKAIGADGREVKPGDTVYDVRGNKWKVLQALPDACTVRYAGDADSSGDNVSIAPERLSHERPDSWERLREDAVKSMEDYWGCGDVVCAKCPAMVDGNKPWERYGTLTSCAKAIQLDLVARAERLAGVRDALME